MNKKVILHEIIPGILIACIVWIFIQYLNNKNIEEEPIPIKLEQPEFFLEDTPNIDLLFKACEYYSIQYPDIVVSQAILETGLFRSELCLNSNNLFGLYDSRKNEFYTFKHWTESVKAYRDKVQYRYKNGDYYQFLIDCNYAEDPLYINKIKNIRKHYVLE